MTTELEKCQNCELYDAHDPYFKKNKRQLPTNSCRNTTAQVMPIQLNDSSYYKIILAQLAVAALSQKTFRQALLQWVILVMYFER